MSAAFAMSTALPFSVKTDCESGHSGFGPIQPNIVRTALGTESDESDAK